MSNSSIKLDISNQQTSDPLVSKPPPKKEKIAERVIRNGFIIVAIFFGLFGTWAFFAPINSAAIATGQLVVDFNRKTIQHFEGGIIEQILVQEGQFVVTGEPLLILSDISAKSQRQVFISQLATSEAVACRLRSERDGREVLDFSSFQKQYHSESEFDLILDTQFSLYISRKKAYQNKQQILETRVSQLDDELNGLFAQQQSIEQQLDIMNQQRVLYEQLVDSQNAPLTHQLSVQREIAQMKGEQGNIEAQIAQVRQKISETKLELLNFENDTMNEILTELQTVELTISELKEQLISASDILKRTTIKAPISGTVMNIQYHTIGAVISPGSDILNIVPKDDDIIVEVKLSPDDIDSVTEGLQAKVQLSAFKAKKVPKLTGTVLNVSADSLMDEMTGQTYYLARIKLDQNEILSLKETVVLNPGMAAQAFIITGARSFVNYLFSPIKDATYKAFREE